MEKATQVVTPEQLHGVDDREDIIEEPEEKQLEVLDLPVLSVRNTVLIPNMVAPLLVTREPSIKAIEEAMNKDHIMFVVTQLHEDDEDPGPDALYIVGVEGLIDRVLKMPDGTVSVLVRGQRRMQRLEYTQLKPSMRVQAEIVVEVSVSSPALEASRRAVLALFEKCVKLNPTLTEETYITAMNIDQPGMLADFVVSSLDMPIPIRQNVLETFHIEQRLQTVSILLSKELDILELENHIHSQVQQEVDKTQREYFLREQLKAIQRELGEGDPTQRENLDLREKIRISGMPEEVKARANKELDRLNLIPSIAPDGGVIRTYLDWLVTLPWNKASIDRLDIKEAAAILDENHYGLNKVKERIYRRRFMQFRLHALGYLTCLIAAAAAIKPAVDFVIRDATQSGFTSYLGLLSSGAVLGTWRDLAMSLAESLPIIETAAFITVVLALIYSLRHIFSVFSDLSRYENGYTQAFQSQGDY